MSNSWIISDTHYNHKNIVSGCSEWLDKSRCRKFSTLDKHNNAVVNNINNVVGQNDFLYHLGDWSFGGKDSILEFRKRLNCKNIVFVHGNHDLHIIKNSALEDNIHAKDIFVSVHDILEKEWGKNKFVLCHYPIYSWHKQEAGALHMYGHIHSELAYHKNAICVSMECHPEFRPFHVDEVLKIIKNRKDEHFANYTKRDSR